MFSFSDHKQTAEWYGIVIFPFSYIMENLYIDQHWESFEECYFAFLGRDIWATSSFHSWCRIYPPNFFRFCITGNRKSIPRIFVKSNFMIPNVQFCVWNKISFRPYWRYSKRVQRKGRKGNCVKMYVKQFYIFRREIFKSKKIKFRTTSLMTADERCQGTFTPHSNIYYERRH